MKKLKTSLVTILTPKEWWRLRRRVCTFFLVSCFLVVRLLPGAAAF
jgi:hypothetical protein